MVTIEENDRVGPYQPLQDYTIRNNASERSSYLRTNDLVFGTCAHVEEELLCPDIFSLIQISPAKFSHNHPNDQLRTAAHLVRLREVRR